MNDLKQIILTTKAVKENNNLLKIKDSIFKMRKI